MAIQKPFAVVPLPLGTVTTGNEIASRPAIHLNEFKNPGMVWQSSGNTNLWVRGNFGSAKAMDFCSVISANALVGTTIRVRVGDTQAEVDGTADYDSTAVAFINPSITRTDGLYCSHLEFPALQTKQWWRIDFAGHTGDFIAAAIVLGKKVQFADFYSPDFEFGVADQAEIDWGRFGVVDEADGRLMRTLSMNFGWMTDSDRSTNFQPLVETLGKRGVALWLFDSDATIQRQSKTYFGWLSSPTFFKPAAPNQIRYQAQFQILSMI